MLIPIKNNMTFKTKYPIEIDRKGLDNKINKNFEEFIKSRENYFNGDIFVVTNYEVIDNYVLFEISKAKYADLVYAKSHRDLIIRSLFSSILFKTKDDYYLLIKNIYGTINTIGGMADKDDFSNNLFIPENCLKREVMEEIGLDINNKDDIIKISKKYIKIPSDDATMYPMGVIYTGILNYTKEEFIKYYNSNKSRLDNEIDKLLFYTRDNYLELENETNKVSYLIELISLLEK